MLKDRFLLALLWLALSSMTVLAQDATCPDLVQTALDYVDTQCSGIERNQACYGNLNVNAVPQPDATDFSFSQPGDIVDVAAIQSLNLSQMVTPDEWGVALLSVQANLPDSIPGQNVTMLLFGDVTIENKSGTYASTVDVTAKSNIRIRSGGGTENQAIGSFRNGTTLQADGRNEVSDWLRVILEDGSGTGWVSAEFVNASGNTLTLPIVTGTEVAGITYGAMQAFYFSSGVGEAGCDEVPQDGILIQTPQGAGSIELLINEVNISVGSTIFLTAQPAQADGEGRMVVMVVEGQATVTEQSVTVIVPAGAQAVIPLDENGLGAGAPRLEGYAAETLTALPVTVLPEAITIAPGLSAEDLRIEIPAEATWQMVMAAGVVTCGPNYAVDYGGTNDVAVTFQDGIIEFYDQPLPASGINTYRGESEIAAITNTDTGVVEGTWYRVWTVQVISPIQMSGSVEVIGACTSGGTIAFTMTLQ